MIRGKALVPGTASGELLVSPEPLSFWGGYDQNSGEIIDRRHPLSGRIARGKLLAVPFARGSSTTTAVLLEAVRTGAAPAAILTTDVDSFLALAAIVAQELYGRSFPVVALQRPDLDTLSDGQHATVHRDGAVEIDP